MTKSRRNRALRSLVETFTILGVLAGLSFSLALITTYPVTGFITFLFISLYALVYIVNASSDD